MFLLFCRIAFGQKSMKDSTISFSMISANGAFQIPLSDLSDRFGSNWNTGGSFMHKSSGNFLFGLDGQFLFGNTVKENTILDSLISGQGAIISESGQFADVILYERGFKFELKAGKVFPVIGPNPNSGIIATIGAGLLQHKIRIENQGSSIPSIEGDYKKGYDRLTNGLSFTAFAGYVNFSNNRKINFFAGIEFTQAFTQNRRSYNFDTMEKDERKRTDQLLGIRAGWIIPVYKRTPRQYYFN
ncbi:MAG: hypothetical protein DWQ44_11715 [Bacteroidetes bacterium]|nr:MAG: hypothetical protein DWQ33_10680 [Bacteroidota bacterium]REK05288.1 MAG: hypothetical protein DWQ39_08845 [Bacteroidota bacterium]REK32693.1 MAG: hypothetical protein DWQ44_11715 [Bacteroidota bacterium]REK48860.1 MAG: hypothetical protein DWQ48_08245 [Bacteroidota bacterium]